MPDDPYPHWYRASAAYPLFGVWPGDLLRYDPTATPELTVVRRLPPNHGGLLLAVEEGAVSRIVADAGVSSLAGARARHGGPPPQSPPPGRVVGRVARDSA